MTVAMRILFGSAGYYASTVLQVIVLAANIGNNAQKHIDRTTKMDEKLSNQTLEKLKLV